MAAIPQLPSGEVLPEKRGIVRKENVDQILKECRQIINSRKKCRKWRELVAFDVDCKVGLDRARCAELLRECGNTGNLEQGKLLHTHIEKNGLDGDTFISNLIVQMYGRCGSIRHARTVFNSMQQRNIYSWNIMIAAYTQNGIVKAARNLFDSMPLQDVASWNYMITGYVQNGHVEEANILFSIMPHYHIVAWNAMIKAYSQTEESRKSILLFHTLLLKGMKPDKITFLGVLDACVSSQARREAKVIHDIIIESGWELDLFVGTALVDMLGKWRDVVGANDLFQRLPQRNVVSWTAMIGVYAQNGELQQARRIFDISPHRNIVSWNAIISAYASNGRVTDAEVLFDQMIWRDVISWTTIISAYSQSGNGKKALHLFRRMDLEGEQPNFMTFSTIFCACSLVGAVTMGKILHDGIFGGGIESHVAVGNSLINMYGKFGCIDAARQMFDKMLQRNVVTWTSMIAAYTENAHPKEAIRTFQTMIVEGVQPNEMSFVYVISACSIGGMAAMGRQFFHVIQEHGLVEREEHYVCMVDVLGRSGELTKAEELVRNMRQEGDYYLAWITLLGCCRMQRSIERAVRISEEMMMRFPDAATPYVIIAGMYGSLGKFDDALNVRKMAEDAGVMKYAEISYIEVNGSLHEFCAGDRHHPLLKQMFDSLQRLLAAAAAAAADVADGDGDGDGDALQRLLAAADVAVDGDDGHDGDGDGDGLLRDEEDVWRHSERMAVAYGEMMMSSERVLLYIVKELGRVCEECHKTLKKVSNVRQIIVRDSVCCHYFHHGMCSCGDKW